MNNFFEIFNLPQGILKKMVILGLATFFIYFGIDHFVNPEFYLSIMPESFPFHDEAVYISCLLYTSPSPRDGW